LVAQAIEQAVRAAASSPSLNLASYAHRSVRIEVNGVFPHSEGDLLEYVATAVEGEAAKAGLRVVPRPLPQVVHSDGETERLSLSLRPSDPEQPANRIDLRLVASVDWGGIDYKEQKYWRKNSLVGVLTFGIAGLNGIGLLGAVPSTRSDVLLGLGAPMVPCLLVAGLWAIFDPPRATKFTLDGRARISLRALPIAAGLAAGQSAGEGESRIVIDTGTRDGYVKDLDIPEKM